MERVFSFIANANRRTGHHCRLVHGYRILSDHGEMSHLAPRPGMVLAIEVQLETGYRQERAPIRLPDVIISAGSPELTQKINHYRSGMSPGIAQRQAAQRPHLLLELVRDAGIQRVVAGIMRSRRNFIHIKLVLDNKELNAQDPDISHVCRDVAGQLLSVVQQAKKSLRRRNGNVQYAVPVAVFTGRKALNLARLISYQHDRKFTIERHYPFKNTGFTLELAPGCQRLVSIPNTGLTLAIVPKARQLENAREETGRGITDIILAADISIRRMR